MRGERWQRAYRERPALFDEFARAEDPGGALAAALAEEGRVASRRVLELGCGTGRLAERLAATCERYVALDREPGMLELAAARLAGRGSAGSLHADARALPLARASIDVVIAGWLLGHMPAPERRCSIAEARRVGRPGARLLLLESAEESEFQRLRDEAGGRRDRHLLGRLEAEGFRRVRQIETSIEFASARDAARVLGYLCGAEDALARNPRRRFSHAVAVLALDL